MKTAPFHVRLFTLFPEMFPGPLGLSLAGRAMENNLWSLQTINPRAHATDQHRTVDDTPFGGGAGMVMKPDVLSHALESHRPHGRLLYMSPRGTLLTQTLAAEMAQTPGQLDIICGRYEGVDQRVLEAYNVEEISVGDYVLSGGEAAALTLLDAIIRLLPGVVGNADTHDEESFTDGLLEYPHYTKPAIWTDPAGIARPVPEVLTSGHHANIAKWRRAQAEEATRLRRPDLWEKRDPKT